jgi:alpha-2-macroglobulin
MTRFVVAIVASAIAIPALAKPLYITVPRSYATTEPVLVDVAFGGKEAVELRVLKPKNLDAYIKEQANLRRAYVEPTTIVNPGRYLSRGLNAVDNPGAFLLAAMSRQFRSTVTKSMPHFVNLPSKKLSVIAEGAKKLINIPEGMELVRSEWLNLDLGGSDRGFDVPGFDMWSSSRSGFQERRVSLKPLLAGVYVLQMVQDRVEGQVTLVVSDMTVQLKQTDGEILVRAAGRDQRPRKDAIVRVHLKDGGPAGKTDDKGEVRLKVNEPRILVTVTDKNDTAVVDTDFYSTLAIAPDVFIYSDRPIYKPGDAVKFRGLVRRPASFLAQLFAPKDREVRVTLKTREGGGVSTKATVDEFGSFFGKLEVPEELETGVVQLVAEIDEHAYQSEARVQAYVKPTFYVELESNVDSVSPGDTITATLKARRYSGGAPAGTKYEVFLYRAILTTPSWVDDAGKGGQGSAVTYGSASTTEGRLAVPLRLYSSVEDRQSKDSTFTQYDTWASAPTFDDKGEATITVTVPPLTDDDKKARLPFKYTLAVNALDPEGAAASAAKQFFFADCDVRPQLSSTTSFVTVAGEATLAVRAITLAGRSFGATKGEITYTLVDADGDARELKKQAITTDSEGVFRDKWPTAKVGTVVASVKLFDKKNRDAAESTKLLVVGTSGETVAQVPLLTVYALPEPLAEGAKARLIALFPEGWGPGGKDAGPVWVTTTGSKIFDTAKIDVSGRSLVYELEAESRFGSSVYASVAYPTATGRWDERTIAFRIIPEERTLRVRVEPEKPEVVPSGEQVLRINVTNSRGQGVTAQLSVGVVDKAIYALQTELRPRILDFFYPLVRNNVMSYYSAEFQGYGYGEYLAKLRGRIRAHEFAAVKPPKVKKKDEDTAFWKPNVVTDGSGSARVVFKLPANSTLWVVTAVAADAAGRFGEATAEFASRGGLTMVASVPQFLRAGDTARGSVRLATGPKAKARELSLNVETLGALRAGKTDQTVKLTGKDEEIVPFELTATEPGTGQVALRVLADGDLRSDRRDLPIKPAAITDRMLVSSVGGGDLELSVPAGVVVSKVELNLMPTTVAASLATVRDLLEYPYGCLEQLIATTIPNVAVYRTLKEVGAFGKLDPESQALLEEANSRSVQGVSRILSLSTKSGGFTWFSGYNEASFPLTLIAIDGLTYAVEAGLVAKDDSRLNAGAEFLAKAKDLPFAIEATRTYVLARLQGVKQAAAVRALLENAPADDMYSMAMAILAADYAGVMGETGVKNRVAALADASAKNVAKVADYRFDEAFWRYPLSRVGLAAILSHAASFGKLDRNEARTRFVSALSELDTLSTFDRSTVLLHNLWLLAEDAKELRDMTPPTVEAKGGSGKATLKPRGAGLFATLDNATTKVKVGKFDGVATLDATVLVPLRQAKESSQGMTLKRSYWLLRPDGREPLKDGDTVAQGQLVFVELEINANEGDWRTSRRSAYYVLEDGLPAGFEPILEDKKFRAKPYDLPLAHEALKYRALSPDKARFFFEEPAWWSRSPRAVGYVIRAQYPGTFAIPPARVADMYAPKISAQTGAASLSVKASGK